MDMWNLVDVFTNVIDASFLILLLDAFFEERAREKLPKYIAFVVAFIVLTVFNYYDIDMTYTLGAFLLTGIVIGFVMYRGSVVARIFIPILLGALIIVSEILVIILLQGIFPNVDVEIFSESNAYRFIGIFISKLLFFIMIKIASRFAVKQSTKLPLQYTFMLLLIPITSIVVLDAILKVEISHQSLLSDPGWMTMALGCLLTINVLVYFLFENLCKDLTKLKEYSMMEQQMALLENHLKEMEASKKENQRIWHDIKNHMMSIRGLVKSKKYSELVRYTDIMFQKLGNDIENVQTGHPVVDALLGSKLAVAKQSGIRVDIDARIPPGIPIEAFDISVVLSNAVDNAIEASHKLVDISKRKIEISMYVKKECLFIMVTNSFEGKLIRHKEDSYISTKEDIRGHGIGLSNIKRTIEKYNGHLKITTEDQVFSLMAIMFFDKSMVHIA